MAALLWPQVNGLLGLLDQDRPDGFFDAEMARDALGLVGGFLGFEVARVHWGWRVASLSLRWTGCTRAGGWLPWV